MLFYLLTLTKKVWKQKWVNTPENMNAKEGWCKVIHNSKLELINKQIRTFTHVNNTGQCKESMDFFFSKMWDWQTIHENDPCTNLHARFCCYWLCSPMPWRDFQMTPVKCSDDKQGMAKSMVFIFKLLKLHCS